MVALSVAALLSISATTYGEDIDQIKDEYEEIVSQKSEVEKQLENNSAMMDRMQEELKSLEDDLQSIGDELREEEQKLSSLNKDISDSKQALKTAEEQLSDKQELLGSRLNSMYKNSSSSYVEVILGSKDMVDLFDRMNMVKNIVSHDKNVIDEVKAQKDDIIDAKSKLELKEKEVKSSAKKLEQKKLEAANLTKSKEVIVSSLKANESGYKAQIETLNDKSNRALEEIRKKEVEKREAEKKDAEAKLEAEAKAKADEVSSETAPNISSSSESSKEQSGSQYEGNTPEVDFSNTEKGKSMVMKATAYDPSPESNGGYGGITAMGTTLRKGVIAVDPRVIPLGTKVYIEYMDGTPLGYCVAEDTGGAIKGNRIDILFMSKTEAFQFGVRDMRLYILE